LRFAAAHRSERGRSLCGYSLRVSERNRSLRGSEGNRSLRERFGCGRSLCADQRLTVWGAADRCAPISARPCGAALIGRDRSARGWSGAIAWRAAVRCAPSGARFGQRAP